MKIALIHDYLNEYGGAERVLEALSEAFPEAPIYTSFYREGSLAYKKFKDKKIITSWVHYVPFFSTRLHSPLRFLAPLIWGSFDFSSYDVVIGSSGWYVTKGFGTRGTKDKKPIEICYCHTPPRWLYGYKTSVEWQKYWPIKVYGVIVGHLMRIYDYKSAQKVDYFIANSEEVKARIKKFYRRDATVIYPPVSLPVESGIPFGTLRAGMNQESGEKDYYFVVARIVGGKGLDLAVEVAKKLGITLKIAGLPAGYYTDYKSLSRNSKNNVEFLGHVTDEELMGLYKGAKAFLALAQDEDFGITPVESMLCGTPVIAYYGGGYKETVIDGKTGIFFKENTSESLAEAIKKFETLSKAQYIQMSKECLKQAKKFSKERFKREIRTFLQNSI